MRRGFTLVEVMFATAISALVMALLASVFVGIPRVIRRSYHEAELSVRMRLLREKLVFAGLLSGADVTGALTDETDIEDRLMEERHIYFVNVRAKRGTGFGEVEHAERIVVPVFGTQQVRNSLSVFHDNLLP